MLKWRLPQPPTPDVAFSDLSGTEDSGSDQATSEAEPAAETEDRPAVGIVCCAHGGFLVIFVRGQNKYCPSRHDVARMLPDTDYFDPGPKLPKIGNFCPGSN